MDVTHPAGAVTATPAVEGRPYGIAVSATGVVIVTRLDAAAVSVGSLGGPLTFATAIPVGLVPTSVAFSPTGTYAYTADQGGTMSVIDVAARAVVRTVPLAGPAFVVAVDSTGTIWVGTNQAWVYRINPGTFAKDSVDVGNHVNGIAFGGGRVFVTDPGNGTVVTINPATMSFVTADVGGRPQGIAARGAVLYVAREFGQLLMLDAGTGAVTDSLDVDQGFDAVLSRDRAQLWVSRPGGHVAILAVPAGGVTNLGPGGDLRRIAFSASGATAVVADQAGRVLIIN